MDAFLENTAETTNAGPVGSACMDVKLALGQSAGILHTSKVAIKKWRPFFYKLRVVGQQRNDPQ